MKMRFVGYIAMISVIVTSIFLAIFSENLTAYLSEGHGTKIYRTDIHSHIICRESKPLAKKVVSYYRVLNFTFRDDYLWLKNFGVDPDVKRYIDQENQFTNQWVLRNKPTFDNIENELKELRVITKYESCYDIMGSPDTFWVIADYTYWIDNSASYPVYKRSKSAIHENCSSVMSIVEVVVDFNSVIRPDTEFYSIGFFEPNPFNENLVAYGIDYKGNERFETFVLNIGLRQTIALSKSAYYSCRWGKADDDFNLYYNVVSEDWGVPLMIEKSGPFLTGKCVSEIIYSEYDPSLIADLHQTSDREFIFIKSAGQITDEYSMIILSSTGLQIITVLPRVLGVRFWIEHNDATFYISSNHQAYNDFALWKISVAELLRRKKVPDNVNLVIPYDGKFFIEFLEVFADYLIIWIRIGAQRQFRVVSLPGDQIISYNYQHLFRKSPYSINPALVLDFDSRIYRNYSSHCLQFSNSSFIQPIKSYNLDMSTMVIYPILEQAQNNLTYSDSIIEKTLFAVTETNDTVPVSIVYRDDLLFLGGAPAMVVAYGAYGGFNDPQFTPDIFPMLKRGYVWAICHPRGDADLGSAWYQSGKFEFKKNSIDDTKACIEWLITSQHIDPNNISFKGRSAGGLLAGNAIKWQRNSRPLLKNVIGHVPFIDPIYDGLNETIPWTQYEKYSHFD